MPDRTRARLPEERMTDSADPWADVATVEREIRFMAYTSAGDPKLMDAMKMYATWAGRLQKAIGDATPRPAPLAEAPDA